MWDREAVARQIAVPRLDDFAYFARTALARALAAAATRELGGGILVDVGCDTRPYEPLFAPHVARYIGVNYPPDAADRAFFAAADLYGDGEHLPLRDGCARTVHSVRRSWSTSRNRPLPARDRPHP